MLILGSNVEVINHQVHGGQIGYIMDEDNGEFVVELDSGDIEKFPANQLTEYDL